MIFDLDDQVNELFGLEPISTEPRSQYYDIVNIRS